MVHSEGFEPSTARFVAEYSIQLSYECLFFKGRHYSEEPLGSQLLITFLMMAEKEGFEPSIEL
jgi:hypothetical protein